MTTSFYIHGVPNGQQIWGDEQDRRYIESFYTQFFKEEERLILELRPAKNRCYYTYLRAKEKNIFDANNREGSYFGMTISFVGVFCTDTGSLFDLFQQVFKKKIVDTVLSQQGGNNFRFKTNSLDSINDELNQIKRVFLNELIEQFDEKFDFETIETNTLDTNSYSQFCEFNIKDVDSPLFFDTLKRCRKIVVSPEFPNKDKNIEKLNKEIDSLTRQKKQLNDEKEGLESELSTLRNKNEGLNRDIQSLEMKKSDDERKINDLQNKNEELKRNNNNISKKVEHLINDIQKPLKDVERIIGDLLHEIKRVNGKSPITDENTDNNKHSGRMKKFMILGSIIYTILVFGFGFFSSKYIGSNKTGQQKEILKLKKKLGIKMKI